MDQEGSKQLQNIIRVPSYLFNDFDMSGTVARMLLKGPKLNELYLIFPADRWQSSTSAFTGTRDRRHQRQSCENGQVEQLAHDRFAHGDGRAQNQPSSSIIDNSIETLEFSIDCECESVKPQRVYAGSTLFKSGHTRDTLPVTRGYYATIAARTPLTALKEMKCKVEIYGTLGRRRCSGCDGVRFGVRVDTQIVFNWVYCKVQWPKIH
jgi:hypothetical protein